MRARYLVVTYCWCSRARTRRTQPISLLHTCDPESEKPIKDPKLRISKFAFGWAWRLIDQTLEHQPIEWLLVQSYRPIATIHLWLRWLAWLLSWHHLIEQLSDKTKRINLVIVLAGWEAQ